MINLMQGDCLEKMKEIESGSVDMILTDPPYGTVKGMVLKGQTSETTSTWSLLQDKVVATAVEKQKTDLRQIYQPISLDEIRK